MGQFDIPPSETCGPDTIQESLSSWAGQSDGKFISNQYILRRAEFSLQKFRRLLV